MLLGSCLPVWFPSSHSTSYQEKGVEVSSSRGDLFPFSGLRVFASHSLQLCCLAHINSGFLCLLGGLVLMS